MAQNIATTDRIDALVEGWIREGRSANRSEAKALHCLPAPLGKPRSRDKTDDPFLACALAARAESVVASDRDLLALGKPFGIAVLTPLDFIRQAGEAWKVE